MEFPQAQPHPCSPFVNLTSPWNCLGLVPWVWILLQTHFPARQILGRVSSTLQALSAAKLNLAFQIFFFFSFPILTEEIKKLRAGQRGSVLSNQRPLPPAKPRAGAGNAVA